MRTCPDCKVVSADAALACECGHRFDPGAAAGAPGAPPGLADAAVPNLRGPSLLAKIGAGVVGYIVGALPVAVIAQCAEVQGRHLGASSNLFMLATGVLGARAAIRMLKRQHGSAPAPRSPDR